MPTILEAFDIEAGGLDLDGRGLLSVLRGREREDRSVLAYLAGGVLNTAVPAKTCLTDGRTKIILNRPYGPDAAGSFLSPPPAVAEVEAYDLAADPGEQTNIAARKAGDAARLVALMKDLEGKGRKRVGAKDRDRRRNQGKAQGVGIYPMTEPGDKEGAMDRFFEIGSLTEDEQEKLAADIEDAIAVKIRDRLLTEKEVREIEEMRLKPQPDILDVQNVYENHLFREKKG